MPLKCEVIRYSKTKDDLVKHSNMHISICQGKRTYLDCARCNLENKRAKNEYMI